MANAKKLMLDLSSLSQEQIEEIQKLAQKKLAPQRPETPLAPVATPVAPVPQVKAKAPIAKVKQTREKTKRMRKINGYSFLSHLQDNNRIRVSCLDDMEQFVVVPSDWSLAAKAAKALATFVKAKDALNEFRESNKK